MRGEVRWAMGAGRGSMGKGRQAMGSGPWVRGGGPWARGCDRGGGDSSEEETIANLQRMRAAPGGKTQPVAEKARAARRRFWLCWEGQSSARFFAC